MLSFINVFLCFRAGQHGLFVLHHDVHQHHDDEALFYCHLIDTDLCARRTTRLQQQERDEYLDCLQQQK